MKVVFCSLVLLAGLTSNLANASDKLQHGVKVPCRLEGERAEVENPFDSSMDDVYVCNNGFWEFFFTNPNSPQQDL